MYFEAKGLLNDSVSRLCTAMLAKRALWFEKMREPKNLVIFFLIYGAVLKRMVLRSQRLCERKCFLRTCFLSSPSDNLQRELFSQLN